MSPANPLRNVYSIGQLELKSELQRSANFLNILLTAVLLLHGVALAAQIIKSSLPKQMLVTGLSFALFLGLFFLNRYQQTKLVAHLFCYLFNLLLGAMYVLNLYEGTLNRANQYGFTLALIILLSGMLIGPKANFWFLGFNSVLVLAAFWFFHPDVALLVSFSFSIISFLTLIAIVSWLYQDTLRKTLQRLRTARRELMDAELLQRDLKIAHDLQHQLYPPDPPFKNGIRIISHIRSARETGGDFYDFIEIGPDKLGIVIADVTGKSLAAALMMTMARSVLRSQTRLTAHPHEVLHHANQTLLQDALVEQMVTAFYGILNTRTLALHFSNAGHPYPILKRNQTVEELELPGLPLKSFAQAEYKTQSVQLQPGDQLVLFSDGVPETRDAGDTLFGFERLKQVILDSNASTPEQMLQTVRNALDTFRGSAEPADDISLVIINIDDNRCAVEAETTAETIPLASAA